MFEVINILLGINLLLNNPFPPCVASISRDQVMYNFHEALSTLAHRTSQRGYAIPSGSYRPAIFSQYFQALPILHICNLDLRDSTLFACSPNSSLSSLATCKRAHDGNFHFGESIFTVMHHGIIICTNPES